MYVQLCKPVNPRQVLLPHVLLLLVLFLATAFFTCQREESFVLRFAVDMARNFARELIETRNYISLVEKGEPEHNYNLVPQVVATQVAKRVTRNTKFYLRQVSLRYRNPNNRPDAYETAQLIKFEKPPIREVYNVVKNGATRSFRYMLPMLATASCLKCHGTYDSAPNFIKKRFPQGHYSYNYRIGEVIGAVSVSIPMEDLHADLGANLKLDFLARGGIFFVVIVVLGTILRRQIIDPVKLLSDGVTHVTRTGDFETKLFQHSKDEIGLLFGAFNDMMDELARRTLQSREADERYRQFIEASNSAVVTFLQDGKIVIVNRKAESLFGQSRESLLGDSIFTYFEDGEDFRKMLDEGGVDRGECIRKKVRNCHGSITEVEIVITVSQTDREPMFTAIIRE